MLASDLRFASNVASWTEFLTGQRGTAELLLVDIALPLLPILWVALLLLAVLIAAIVRWRRAPTREELEAIGLIARALREECTSVLDALQAERASGGFDLAKERTVAEIGAWGDGYEGAVRDRLDGAVNNDLFLAALKAKMPRKQWRRDFDRQVGLMTEAVLEPDSVERELRAIVKRNTTDFLALVDARRGPRSDFAIEDAVDGLTSRPARLRRFVGDFSLFETALDDLAVHRTGAYAGLGLAGATSTAGLVAALLPPQEFAWVAGKLLGLKWSGAENLVMFATDLIVEELGEEAVTEFIEAMAAAATGVGLLFAGYKTLRYGWLAKRLLMDQAHLEEMRAQLLEGWLDSVNDIRERAPTDAREAMDSVVERYEQSLRHLRSDADRQLDWVERRMPAAA